MTIQTKDIQSIREGLKKRKLSDLDSDNKPLSTRQAILILAPTILKMKEKGFTNADITETLRPYNLEIKAHNLSRYLREFQKMKKPTKQETTVKRASSENAAQPDVAVPTAAPAVAVAPTAAETPAIDALPAAATAKSTSGVANIDELKTQST
ncbi:hypothetical protein C4J81_06345 [Deltaproteobacteria bacterium Smac51]|nr:hypothetical protein C4J81_06345 [Deltaproteobacteria bacterium Smac51]